MCVFLVFATFLIFELSCAPVEDGYESHEYETTETVRVEGEERQLDDSQGQSDKKNPVQEWFENLSKNASTNTQNAFNTVKDWLSKLSNNNSNAGGVSNLPVMYMGSFQLVKMPMPQFTDVIKGMGDLATAAQTVNKLTGGGGLPIPIPGLQG